MPSIADLFVTVTSDVSGAISGLTSVDQKVNGTSAALAAAAPAGYALAAAAGAVGAAFVSSVATATDFEHQINGIKSVMSPAEVNEFGAAVQSLALTLGKDTVFTSAQAADAIETLIKAGVPLPAILDGAARSALDLASATGTDVTIAAELASTAMNAFHVDASKLPDIMDTISNVSNATATSVQNMRFALAAVGPVANGLGLSFSDTATAIGIFANNGLQGSDAGTSLKTMLLNLEPNTKSQTAAFKELGLITADGSNQFFDAAGNAKSMRDVFEILKTSTANLTLEQKVNLLQTAFGTDAVRAATIAANEGASGWDAVRDSMEKMGGTQIAAAQRNAGLTGSLNQLGGSFESIQIQVGTLFLPVLTQLVNFVTNLLNAFLTLDPGIQTTIVAVVGITGAAAGLLAGFILLGPVIGAVGAAFGIIAGAAAAVAVPIALLVAAGALLYEAWQTDFGGIREVTEQVRIAIQPAIKNIQDFVTLVLNNLGPAFTAIQAAMAPFITALSNDLTPVLARIPDLVRLIGDGFNALSPILQSIWAIFQLLITGNFTGGIFGLDQNSGLVQFFVSMHDAIALFFDAVLKLLNGDFQGAWDSLWSSFTTALQAGYTAELQLFGLIRDAIIAFLQAIPGWIADNVPGMWQAFTDELGQLPGQLQPYWDAFLGWLGSVIAQIPDFVAASAGNLWSGLVAAFTDLVPQVAPAWDAFAGWLGSVLGGIGGFVADAIGDIWAPLRDSFYGLVDQLAPAWDAFAGWLGAVLGGIAQFVADNMGDLWSPLRDAFFGLVDQLAPAWDAFAGWLESVLGGLPQFVADHIGDVWGALVAAFTGSTPGTTTTTGGTTGGGTPPPVPTGGGTPVDVQSFINALNLLPPIFDGLVAVMTSLNEGVANLAAAIVQSVQAQTAGNGTGSGPIVSIGTLVVSSQEQADAFLDLVAQAVLASANRVSPPVTGANPVLG